MPLDPARVAGLLLALAAPRALAQEADPAPPPATARIERVVFGDALEMRVDRLLEGVDATEDVVFHVPGGWDIVEDPTLHIAFDHSSALLPERSHLTIGVNGHPLTSVALDARNGVGGVLQVRIPREILQPYNHVSIRAIQHVSNHCEEPFDPSLWTRVRKQSWVELPWAPKGVRPDLAALPFPFVDDTGYGPAEIDVIVGERPTPATVAAAGRIGLALGRQSPYREVRVAPPVADVRLARGHAIVVGLVQENPQVRALLGNVTLGPSQGLVAMTENPADPTLAVLVVTAVDAEGLARAAAAVTGGDRAAVLSGSRTLIDEAVPSDPPENRRRPRGAPDRASYSFADLGLADRTVRGFTSPTLRVPLGLEGDAVVRPGAASVRLDYAYAARLDPRLSAMEVRIDGVTVKTAPLLDPDGDAHASTTVEIPESLLRPDAELEVAFHTIPKDFDACQYISDRTLWATLYASSTVELPRDHVAGLPDLGRLRHDAWPLTLVPGEGEVVVALADQPTREDVAAGVQVAAWLGNRSRAEAPAFRMAPASEVSFGGSPDAHFVLLAGGSAHALQERLARGGHLAMTGVGGRHLHDEARRLLVGVMPGAAYGTLEEVLSPSNEDRVVLVLEAPDPAGLIDLVRVLADEPTAHVLDGNVAVVAKDGGVRTAAKATRRQVGSYAVGTTLQLAVRRHWMFVGAGLIAGAFLLTAARRAWARTRGGQ